MDESGNDRILGLRFIINAIFNPKANIDNSAYMSVKESKKIFLLLFLGIHFISAVINIPIMSTMSIYAPLGGGIVFIGLCLFIFWIPIFLINVRVLNFLNDNYSGTTRSYQKIWSDHITILIRYFLLYSIGFWLFAYMETLYTMFTGQLIILVSCILYIIHSIYLVIHYVKDVPYNTFVALRKYVLMGMVMIALASIPFLIPSDEFGEIFVQSFLRNLRMILTDVGVV